MSDLYDTDTESDTEVQPTTTDQPNVQENAQGVSELNISPPHVQQSDNDTQTEDTPEDQDEDNEKMKMIKANIPRLLELLGKNDDLQTTLFDMLNKPEEVKTDAASEVDFCSFQ